ncbi:hypothetical protein K466DRAFT_598664 [Polyporus arcularius HHB13444]|uniref:Uncharacterized protein n=1 Tax=Polyporus arcularius HHB13444 TaxID=1314778 RepID=A0A5C3PFN5_9APHY|nr:hypothetical protein K466DRAFT_598664 [Polyporus arcularius HHB13444]
MDMALLADASDKELKEIRARASLGGAPQTNLEQITFARADRRKGIKLPDVDQLARALHATFPRLRGPHAERQSTLYRLLQKLASPETRFSVAG